MLWLIDQTESLQTMQKLKEADEAKTQFLMRVSHELRTPMNTMLGMNEMILRESSENSIRSYAVEVAGAGEHMMALINEVLDAARLEDGRLTIVREPYRIGDVLDRAEELMRPQAQEKGLQFYFCKEFPPVYRQKHLMGDAVHLRQAVVNLLSNAMKYTDEGFVQLGAGVKSRNGQSRLWIAVKDSGIGIRREDLSRIFENFERGRNTGGKEGMGLGLAIVKRLVEAMEGTLTVESISGKGSTFTFEIPWVEASQAIGWNFLKSRYANDDPDFYWEILTMFQEQYGEHKEKLISLSENLDTIGERTEAGREENSDELKKLLPDLLTEWEYVVNQIQKYSTT